MVKTVFLIDPFWSGHHSTYMKFFAKILLDLGNKVVVLCPNPHEVYEWILQYCTSSITGNFFTFEIQDPTCNGVPLFKIGIASACRKRWEIALATIQSVSCQINLTPDLVFFAWLDSYLGPYLTHQWVDQVFPYQWSGLYFHIYHLRIKRALSPIRQRIFNPDSVLHSSRCKFVAILDEGVADELQQRLKGKPVVVFPDFADDAVPETNYFLAEEIKEKANNRKIIGLLGSLSKRKGILTLMEIAHRIDSEQYFFLLAGKLSTYDLSKKEIAKIYQTMDNNPDNWFFYLDKIPDESHFNTLINMCDVLFAAYEKFPSSSNILAKAAIFQKPVIVSNGYCLAERVQKYNLGLIIEECNVQQGIDAITSLCNAEKISHPLPKAMFQEYQQRHSPNRLDLSFASILKKYL